MKLCVLNLKTVAFHRATVCASAGARHASSNWKIKDEREVWLRLHPEPWNAETEQEYHRRFSSAIERWLDAGLMRWNEPAVARRLGGAPFTYHVMSPFEPAVPEDGVVVRHMLEAADALAARGFLVTAIRPPTVPPGTSRLRVALSADHTFDQIDALADALAEQFPTGP